MQNDFMDNGLSGSGFKVGIVLSEFNVEFVEKLFDGTVNELKLKGVVLDDVDVVRVPGALELPFAVDFLLKNNEYDVVIALGVVIKGATYHFELVSNESHRGLMDVGLKYGVPVVFGVLSTYSKEQALERVSVDGLNKGREFAQTAIYMAHFKNKYK